MNESKHQALNLLRKAEEDLSFATSLSKDSGTTRRGVGFHAQQAVEKALKAVLMYHEIQYPFTHDIKALMKLVKKTKVPLPPNSHDFSRLTPFATVLRYEDEEWGLSERFSLDDMLGYAEMTLAWAKSTINGDEPEGV